MAVTTRRVYFEKTVKYKFALDIPNNAGMSNSAALSYATGTAGPLNSSSDIGELLAGSVWNNGSETVTSNWAVSSSPAAANIEEYFMFTPSYAYTLNQRVVPTDPANAISGSNAFVYKVTSAGTTASSEPTWPTTVNQTVTSGGVTFQCIAKY